MEIIYFLLIFILLYIVFVQEKIISYENIKESFNFRKTSWTRSKDDETYYRWEKTKNIIKDKKLDPPSPIINNSSAPKEIDENLIVKGNLSVGKNIANYKLDVDNSIYAKEFCFKKDNSCPNGYLQTSGNFINKNFVNNGSNIPNDEQLICYANKYPDLKKTFGYDTSRLREHWHKHGRKEKRNSDCSVATENTKNCKDCAFKCNQNPNCKSYQCSPTESKCYLNFSSNPPEKKDLKDYNLCIKDESGCKDDPSCPSPEQASNVCSRNDIVGEQARIRCPNACKTGCNKKNKFVKFSEGKGGRNVCKEGNPVDNMADCKTAAVLRNKVFSGNVNRDDRPKGCFWDINNKLYFNTGNGWGDKGGNCNYGRICRVDNKKDDYICLNKKDMRAVHLEPSNRELCIGDTCINKTDIGILKSMAYDKQVININSYHNCSSKNNCKRCHYPYFYERNYKDGRTYCYRTASNYKGMPNPVACTIGHDNPGRSAEGKIFGTYVDGGSNPTVVKCGSGRWEKVFYKNPTNKIKAAHDRLDNLRLKSRVKTNLGQRGDPTQSHRVIHGNCTGSYDDYTFHSEDYGGQKYIHSIHGH